MNNADVRQPFVIPVLREEASLQGVTLQSGGGITRRQEIESKSSGRVV